MPEVALAAVRTGVALALGIVAITGAAIAGMEKALTTPDPPPGPAERATGPLPAPEPVPGSGSPSASRDTRGLAPPPCSPPVRICVRLSRSELWLLDPGGAAQGPIPVRHGRLDAPTPVGTFPVEFKNAAHVNSVTGLPMPFAVFFAGDLALYQADLTQPSAGSIRVPPGPAETLYRQVAVGDLIQVVPQ
jgi:hypothetical protein